MQNLRLNIFPVCANINLCIKRPFFSGPNGIKSIHFHNLCCVCFLAKTLQLEFWFPQLNWTHRCFDMHAVTKRKCSWCRWRDRERKIVKKWNQTEKFNSSHQQRCWFYCRQAANKLVKLRFLSHTTLSSHVKHDQFRKRRTQCSNFMEIMDELLVLDILRTHEIDFYKLQCEIKLIFA